MRNFARWLGVALTISMIACGFPRPADIERDAQRAECPSDGTFDTPMPVAGLSAGNWASARLDKDELALYASGIMSGTTAVDLFVARRTDRMMPFGPLTRLSTSSVNGNDYYITVSDDEKVAVFDSDREGKRRLYIALAAVAGAEFASAAQIAGISATSAAEADADPFLTADGTELWFSSSRAPTLGEFDLYRSSRAGSGFANPEHVMDLSSSSSDGIPVLSFDRLTIYFQSLRPGPGTTGSFDIWSSHRSAVSDGFPAPKPLTEVNSTGSDLPSWLSEDGCRLYLTSSREGGMKIYLAERHPRA